MTLRIALLAVSSVLLAGAATPKPAPTPVPGPVAVMPFKNLNAADASIAWLEKGIAETMVSDLKRAKVEIVERTQVEKALAEIAAQQGSNEDAQAARVGKLVGAKTIVLGSYQKADKQLRINARFVTVETGVVIGTAKATGPLSQVFALQDQVVDKLLGLPAGKVEERARVASRPKRKATPAAVDAYRLYAMSLVTATDAERSDLLKRSIAIDADFVYAIDDLAALEKRMAAYGRISAQTLLEKDRVTLAKIEDAKTPGDERTREAKMMLDRLNAERRWRTMALVAERVRGLDLPSFMGVEPNEYASFYLFFAQYKLKKYDVALQLGERHLKEHPGGLNYPGVERIMQGIVEKRRERAARLAEYEADLKEKRDDLLTPDGTVTAEKQAQWDFAPCIATRWNRQIGEMMLKHCSAFADKYATTTDPDVRDDVISARLFTIIAHTELGEFERAKPLAESLIAEVPRYASDAELQALKMEWPAD